MWAGHRRSFAVVVAVVAAVSSMAIATPAVGSSTGSRWRWLNPSPQGNSVSSIVCPTETMCVDDAAVAGASISHDGGATWIDSPIGLRSLAEVFACPSATVCFEGGWGGTVFKTVNGGESWMPLKTRLRHFKRAYFKAISCPSVTSCFLVGSNRIFVSTQDGGATWDARGTVAGAATDSLSCPDVQTCYVATGVGVTKTDDSGVTWNTARDSGPDSGTSISCPTTSICYLAESPIEKTVDGGNVWTPQIVPGTTGRGATAMHCTDATHCIEFNRDHDVVSTADGESWSVTLPASAITAFDSALVDFGCVPSGTMCLAAGTHGLLFRSDDAGQTWDEIDHTVTRNGLDAVSCHKNFCVAVGGDQLGTVLVTTNGGTSWSSRQPETYDAFASVSCASATVCVAAGLGGYVMVTIDAGATWTEMRVANDLEAVSCPSVSKCFATTRGGAIFTTSDPAVTWHQATSAPVTDTRVSCPTTKICYVSGATQTGSAVSKTIDGAKTWTTTAFTNLPELGGISCSSAQHCATVGFCQQGSSVCADPVTFDGGQTWQGSSASHAGFDAVSCTSTTFCVAVGRYGAAGNGGDIQVSSDGGFHWAEVAPLTWEPLHGVSCVRTKCVAVGGGGTVLAN